MKLNDISIYITISLKPNELKYINFCETSLYNIRVELYPPKGVNIDNGLFWPTLFSKILQNICIKIKRNNQKFQITIVRKHILYNVA